MTSRSGFTLIELAVTTAIFVLLLSIAAASLASLLAPPGEGNPFAAVVESERARAIESGERSVVLLGDSAGRVEPLLVFPDGRALGQQVDPLDGAFVVP
jgi:prepilin-type N-terminal cleavage/methylation domain-containing protein